jgi:retron-type reverse transcriptase
MQTSEAKSSKQNRGRLHRSSGKYLTRVLLKIGTSQGCSQIGFIKFNNCNKDEFEKRFPELSYERYADDIIVHCHSQKQAEYVLDMIRKRMMGCKLELHPEKTKIIYCKRNYKEKTAKPTRTHKF